MKLKMFRRLEGDLHASINEFKKKPCYVNIYGFTIAVLNEEDNFWYVDTAYFTDNIEKILNKDEKYKDMHKALEINEGVKLLPIAYADSFVLSEKEKSHLEDLAKKGYDVAIISGFATLVYKSLEKPSWYQIELIDKRPNTTKHISVEFAKLYLKSRKDYKEEKITIN